MVYDERILAWSMGCRPSLSDERPFRAFRCFYGIQIDGLHPSLADERSFRAYRADTQVCPYRYMALVYQSDVNPKILFYSLPLF